MTNTFTYNYPKAARDSGFKLRNYKDGPLDWRLVGSMEIERIIKDQSFEQIDAVLNHLSEVPLGSILDSNILDSGIAKYFMLSQFSVQYLIFCRKFLEETVTDLRESHGESQMELATLKRNLSEANNEILQLHKKITQMEAIHEVIYPCHMCTKNFVSNDALNLHISRKHNESLARSQKKSESSHSPSKERENDLTLINTIKLQLEIKQLKERLNNAEREIKEKHFESDVKKIPEIVSEVFQKSEKISVHSIGIQSNLSEIKEKDDSTTGDLSSHSLNGRQLSMLQEKLQEFVKWKEEQKIENSEFLAEVNKKIQDIYTVLETTLNDRVIQKDNDNGKTSLEDLERLLMKKVEEIGKITAANIEDVVKNMEFNYKAKLHRLEKDLIKLNEQFVLEKDFKSKKNHTKSENCYLETTKMISTDLKVGEVNDETPDCKNNEQDKMNSDKIGHPLKETSASESNHTFVKYSDVLPITKNSDSFENTVTTSGVSDEDGTDVSASISDEEEIKNAYKVSAESNKNQTHILNEKNFYSHTQQRAKPKIITKKDAKRMTNNRLSSLGVDMKTRTLTPSLKKGFFEELNERRSKLKQKHPQYYATRNKIKNFVDKLCSTKLPPNAKALLKATKDVKPKIQKYVDDDDDLSENGDHILKASTPNKEISTNDRENFKLRLDRILASPIRKPDDHLVKAIVHFEDKNKNPIPLPRKRVMFNHPEVLKRPLNPSLIDESE